MSAIESFNGPFWALGVRTRLTSSRTCCFIMFQWPLLGPRRAHVSSRCWRRWRFEFQWPLLGPRRAHIP